MKTTAMTLLCWGCLAVCAPGGEPDRETLANWHQWRGPLATGMAPKGDPPLKWDEKTNVRWKTAIPGKGSATPIVWGDRVFVLTAVKTDRTADAAKLPQVDPKFVRKTEPPRHYYRFLVLCLDRSTGKVRWQQTATEQVPHEGIHPSHSYAAGSPTTDGKFLYVSFGSRGVYCYDLDGNLQWQRDLGRLITRYGWGEASTPVLHKDRLIVNWDHEGPSKLFVLDAKTGKTVWEVDRDEVTTWTTPLAVDYKGRTQVIVNATKRARSYDLATGKVLWECGGQTVNVIPAPVSAGGVVYCLSGYGAAGYAIPLDARGDVTDTAKILWRLDKGTPYVPSPLLDNGLLYFTQMNKAFLTCVDAKTGKVLMDRERLPALTELYASPSGAAGRIYLTGRDGTTMVLKRGGKLEVLSVNPLDDRIDASPAIAGRQLFLRGENYLYCLEER
jgi:outer membrane protein assembly factor BamB